MMFQVRHPYTIGDAPAMFDHHRLSDGRPSSGPTDCHFLWQALLLQPGHGPTMDDFLVSHVPFIYIIMIYIIIIVIIITIYYFCFIYIYILAEYGDVHWFSTAMLLNYRRVRRRIERHHMIHMILGWYVIPTVLPHHAIRLPYLQPWRISRFIPTQWQCYAMLNKKNVKVVINWSTIKIHPNGGTFQTGFPMASWRSLQGTWEAAAWHWASYLWPLLLLHQRPPPAQGGTWTKKKRKFLEPPKHDGWMGDSINKLGLKFGLWTKKSWRFEWEAVGFNFEEEYYGINIRVGTNRAEPMLGAS